ncbi:hypothetical protein BFV93_4807 [Alteromonas macleodii]|nr:hypothetical protein BFV93_4807 [Alteromonas macleodii]
MIWGDKTLKKSVKSLFLCILLFNIYLFQYVNSDAAIFAYIFTMQPCEIEDAMVSL